MNIKESLKYIIFCMVFFLIVNLSVYFILGNNFADGFNPYQGLNLSFGLLFGPYAAIGIGIANFITDIIRGYGIGPAFYSISINIVTVLFAYHLWYGFFNQDGALSAPNFNSCHNILKFVIVNIMVSALYSVLMSLVIILFFDDFMFDIMMIRYFLNSFNFSFIFGIFAILLNSRFNLAIKPNLSNKKPNPYFYKLVFIFLIVSLFFAVYSQIKDYDNYFRISIIVAYIFMIIYLFKPIFGEFKETPRSYLLNRVLIIFAVLFTILLVIIEFFVVGEINSIFKGNFLNINVILIMVESVLILTCIPSILIIYYIERNVLIPLYDFSLVSNLVSEDKFESDEIIQIYSKYIDKSDEIGDLSKTYTNIIRSLDEYIINLRDMNKYKDRIDAELDIASSIQENNLPYGVFDNDYISINAYYKSAREVGGDFYDFYKIDEDNIAFMIGDASGKGVPAAIISLIAKTLIKNNLKINKDPGFVLTTINKQLCETNMDNMFLTLWLGVYNINSNKVTFSNAGHNQPLICVNNEFKLLNMDSALVLSLMDDFTYKNESFVLEDKIILYTDGITDAINNDNEFYGVDNLIKSVNGSDDLYSSIINDLNDFVGSNEQYDDITFLILNKK